MNKYQVSFNTNLMSGFISTGYKFYRNEGMYTITICCTKKDLLKAIKDSLSFNPAPDYEVYESHGELVIDSAPLNYKMEKPTEKEIIEYRNDTGMLYRYTSYVIVEQLKRVNVLTRTLI